jgi:hypothetical protein
MGNEADVSGLSPGVRGTGAAPLCLSHLCPLPLQGDRPGQRRNPGVRPPLRPPAAEGYLLQHGQRCWLGVSPGATELRASTLGNPKPSSQKPKKNERKKTKSKKPKHTKKQTLSGPCLELALKNQEAELCPPRACTLAFSAPVRVTALEMQAVRLVHPVDGFGSQTSREMVV